MREAKTLSAGIILLHRQRDWRVLLLRSYTYWDFPKGQVEEGEKPFQAAKRELKEETGITEVSFPFGDMWYETEVYGRGKIARYYIAETRSDRVILPVNPELGRAEHQEYHWFNFKEAEKILVPRVVQALNWAEKELKGHEESPDMYE